MNQELTTIEKEIVNIAEQRYIESGYMYEGHIAPNMSVITKLCKNPIKVLYNMIEKNILIKRDCEAISFALVKSRRLELIREHDLSNVWQKKASCFYPNSLECGEIPKILICEKHSLHKEIIDAILKMEKIEKHQKDFMEKYNAIIASCGVGQIPEVGHRTLEKAMNENKKRAQIWNKVKHFIYGNFTLWQIAIISNLDVEKTGNDEILKFSTQDLKKLLHVEGEFKQ